MGILRLALGEGTTMMKLSFLLALLPSLWLRPSPRLMPIPTTATTASATTATDTDSASTDTDTPTPTATTDTTARGLLTEPAAAPEAEAAADPYYGYYGLGYHGLGYRAYGGYYGHGLGYYGY